MAIFTRRYGSVIFMLLTCLLSGNVLAASHTATKNQKVTIVKKSKNKVKINKKDKVSNKQEYSRNNVTNSRSLPDLRKYPSGTPRKKAFLRTVMPYITKHNRTITADRHWLVAKQNDTHWSPAERNRLKKIAEHYKVRWSGNSQHIPWHTLLERVDIIPDSMVATMAAAESGWGTSKIARNNNNLFGMKCSKCQGTTKGYSQFDSVEQSIQAYVTNLNTHPAYHSFRKSRAQLRQKDQELTASEMIHKLESYSTSGTNYNNYLFTMYQSNRQLIAAHM